MVSHTDYPLHGVCELAYPDDLENGKINVRLVFQDSDGEWILHVSNFNSSDSTFIGISLFCFGIKHYEEFRFHYYLRFMNHQDESKSKVFIKRCDSRTKTSFPGHIFLESKALDTKNGWLKDGKLSVVFGIHVEAFKETIWKFNFNNPTFQHEKTNAAFAFGLNGDKLNRLYSHKQLLIHHFPSVLKMGKKCVGVHDHFKFDSLEKCLQILNGARITIELNDLLKVLKMAHYFNLYTVIRYCEMELIQRKDEIKFIKNHIQFATHNNLNRYLASVFKDMETLEATKENFCHLDINFMSGEMMKQCVMKLFGFY